MKRRLSVLLPVKNERHNLPACLESVRDLADEIVVADSGSSDGTIEYARSQGCRVIEREYRHAGDFKNWAIPQCRHEWVLLLDADERLTPRLAREIADILDGSELQDGYWIYRRTYFLGRPLRYSGCSSDKVLRLFRRDEARYVGETDHAEIDLPAERTAFMRERMEHYSYHGLDDYFRKFHRYTKQKAELRFAGGKQPSALKMLFTVPVRFAHLYFIRWGFLDGIPGMLFSMYSAVSSFTAQARLWELHIRRPGEDSNTSAKDSRSPVDRAA